MPLQLKVWSHLRKNLVWFKNWMTHGLLAIIHIGSNRKCSNYFKQHHFDTIVTCIESLAIEGILYVHQFEFLADRAIIARVPH